jgi:hypothetical protein
MLATVMPSHADDGTAVISDFANKPTTHLMCDQDHLFHTHGHIVLTDSQMSRIKYNYYINNVSRD